MLLTVTARGCYSSHCHCVKPGVHTTKWPIMWNHFWNAYIYSICIHQHFCEKFQIELIWLRRFGHIGPFLSCKLYLFFVANNLRNISTHAHNPCEINQWCLMRISILHIASMQTSRRWHKRDESLDERVSTLMFPAPHWNFPETFWSLLFRPGSTLSRERLRYLQSCRKWRHGDDQLRQMSMKIGWWFWRVTVF